MKKKSLFSIKPVLIFIFLFILFCGCDSKFKHFFNQENAIGLHIDSLVMLKLLQVKNKKFNIANINILVDLKNDPFKRLLNRDDYVKDLEITSSTWNNTEEYNNSFYIINSKYQKYLMDPWDDILLKVLYADILGFNKTDFDRLLSLKSGKGDYTDTHVFLALIILKQNNGFDQKKIDISLKELAAILVKAQDKDKIFSDLYAERVVFLYWAGFGNLVKKEWINIIKNSKNKDMGWSDYQGEESNPHSTGLALLSIIYFKEGKSKQDFY